MAYQNLTWELAEWQPGMPVCWHLKNGGPYPIGSIVEVGGVSNRAYECKAFTCNEMGEADYLYIGLIITSIDDAKAAVEGAHEPLEAAA